MRGATLSRDEFGIMHALRIRGLAPSPAVASSLGIAVADAERLLRNLSARGVVDEASRTWGLSEAGFQIHCRFVGTQRERLAAAEFSELVQLYARDFVPLNRRLKELCTQWQLRRNVVNDHSDASYDRAIIAHLAQIQIQVERMCRTFATFDSRFDLYAKRLHNALERASAGETRAVTGVFCESYHGVWMELHKDLVVTLGVERRGDEE